MLSRHLRPAIFAATCVLAGTAWAQARPSAGILNAFGFFGRWAMQCGAPPSPANIVRTVTWSGHEPVEYSETITPRAVGNRYRVISARMPNAATLVLEVRLNGRIVENLTFSKNGSDAIRTIWNRSARRFLVREGVVVANGHPTPWLHKCR